MNHLIDERISKLAEKEHTGLTVPEAYELQLLVVLKDQYDDHADMMNMIIAHTKCIDLIAKADMEYFEQQEVERIK